MEVKTKFLKIEKNKSLTLRTRSAIWAETKALAGERYKRDNISLDIVPFVIPPKLWLSTNSATGA